MHEQACRDPLADEVIAGDSGQISVPGQDQIAVV
jgi:hypothetical protein